MLDIWYWYISIWNTGYVDISTKGSGSRIFLLHKISFLATGYRIWIYIHFKSLDLDMILYPKKVDFLTILDFWLGQSRNYQWMDNIRRSMRLQYELMQINTFWTIWIKVQNMIFGGCFAGSFILHKKWNCTHTATASFAALALL